MAKSFHNIATVFLLFLLLIFLPYGNSTNFKLPRFNVQSTDMLYQGDAAPNAGTIELISNVNYLCRVGWATFANTIQLWDSASGKFSDFATHFSFTIDTLDRPIYGHGITFFLAPAGAQIPPNSAGGFLGLFNTTTRDSSQNHIVMVEFDTFPNPEWDPAVEHVGININSVASSVYTPWNASLHSGDTADAWITYDSASKNLSVSWTFQKTLSPLEKTSLSYVIDLKAILPEWVTVGFTAATGQYGARHILKSWEFSSS
ncbi:hypothetical protein Tsubulata_008033 [Turnera subulata]|uniref:DOMON domain-containing protein n=1 Tax=Turnera subulata TaxID=218843 RepID=A0A9Q0FR83_9ROSI|nr:hypothetical protein Tsubulata_008033 [Turnera subulata]